MTIIRAYATLESKQFDESKRVIRGFATTPSLDRVGDSVDQFGVTVAESIPLFLYHDSRKTVGRAKLGKATSKGIPFEATFPNVTEAGALKDRIDEAIAMVQYGLITAVSIGFRVLENAYELIQGGGVRYLKTEVMELSLVPVPAQPEAVITGFKSMSEEGQRVALLDHIKSADLATRRAAPGARPVVRLDPAAVPDVPPPGRKSAPSPGVSGTPNQPAKRGLLYVPKGNEMKTIQEQIAAFNAQREQKATRLSEIMEKAGADLTTLDEAEDEEYETLQKELGSIDKHVARLKTHEALVVAKAAPITPTAGQEGQRGGVEVRGGAIVSVRPNVEKGMAFTRFALAMIRAKGNVMQAAHLAKHTAGWQDTTPQVLNCLQYASDHGSTGMLVEKAAVAAATTSDSTWAGPLVQYQDMASEFIELLRPMTILGKMTGVRRVPFNIRIARQTAGVSGSFVGEGAPKPVNKMAFDNMTMGWFKAAVIVVMTDEVMRFSNPAIENLARQDMLNGIAQYLDTRFIDPAYSGVSGVSPASITNGATSYQSTGNTIAAITSDVKRMISQFVTNNLSLTSGVWVMSPVTALGLSMLRDVNDEFVFPGLTIQGGTFFGMPVITSNSVIASGSPNERHIVLVDQSEILLADDGEIAIDMSQEASLQMNDAPSAGAQSLVSLWQNNMVGLRAERYVNWARRRPQAVALLENVGV